MLKFREPFNAISHYAGAAAALLGSYYLLSVGGSTPDRVVSLLIYSASLFGLFFASGTYHGVAAGPKLTQVLRKIDHSAIYLLITGSYTPFCIIALSGFWQWGMLAIIWTLALAGILVKVFIIRAPRWFTAGVYVVMGWLSVFAAREMLLRMPPAAIAWLVAGGLFYTLGAVVYVTKKGDFFPGRFGFHEIWHLFVLSGAAAHFVAVTHIL
jgi:hemolysin III